MKTITCISLFQPWASALFLRRALPSLAETGGKLGPLYCRVVGLTERGPVVPGQRLAIHASRRPMASRDVPAEMFAMMDEQRFPWRNLPYGVLLGTVEVADYFPLGDVQNGLLEWESKWVRSGFPIGMVVREPRALRTPIPMRGQLGFYRETANLAEIEGGGDVPEMGDLFPRTDA